MYGNKWNLISDALNINILTRSIFFKRQFRPFLNYFIDCMLTTPTKNGEWGIYE